VNELQENKVDWRDVLSKWLGEKGINLDFTYRRPSRRSESCGAYMPSYQRYGIDDVVVLWDTSGSMNGRETAILSEIAAICDDLGLVIRVICIDTQIHTDTHDVKSAIDMAGKVKGGGGSDFTPAFDLLEDEQYQGVVVAFTDGYIGVPDTKPPLIKDVLWCIEPRCDTDPTGGRWGDVLKMED
jgi:predicted metal-dependent peptidase